MSENPASLPFVGYSLPARVFHWTIAAAIPVTLVIALIMDGEIFGFSEAAQGVLFDTHKLIGLVILLVVLLRVAYRLKNGAPPQSELMPEMQRKIGSITHVLLYVLLLVIPVLGYAGSQLFGAINLFNRLPIPVFLPHDEKLGDRVFVIHTFLGYAIMALAALHIGAALYHLVVRKDGVFARMWPGMRLK